MAPLSVLDLAPVTEGSGVGDALRNTLELAQHAESLGYLRYWLAEHHGMPGIASAATSIVVAHVAAGTETIRVGSGGVMLPNHAPLVIAEQFGTLEALHPGRIDLGLGRAPGTDMLTARALRRDLKAERFPEDVLELQAYFAPSKPGQRVRAVPGEGLRVPLWLLGSSLFSAQLAGKLGLPFAFASHFAPDAMMQAIAQYRALFTPSAQLEAPYVMLCLNVIAAETDEEARYLSSSLKQAFVRLRRGEYGKLPPPVEDIGSVASPVELAGVERVLAYSLIGAPDTIERGLRRVLEATSADEIMIAAQLYDPEARKRSLSLVAAVRDAMG